MKNGKTSEAGNLYPGYFGLVMAAGIISIAAFQKKWLAVFRRANSQLGDLTVNGFLQSNSLFG
jgi:hypothetical protein